MLILQYQNPISISHKALFMADISLEDFEKLAANKFVKSVRCSNTRYLQFGSFPDYDYLKEFVTVATAEQQEAYIVLLKEYLFNKLTALDATDLFNLFSVSYQLKDEKLKDESVISENLEKVVNFIKKL